MSETVETNGLRFRCRVDGRGGNAPWLVFSNSLVTDLTVWDHQVAAFADEFNILRYDQRGHGGTGVPAEPCRFETLADDVVKLLEHFGIDRCTFVGLSMGVPTGLQLFSTRPDLIEGLVFCDGLAATTAERGAIWKQRVADARVDGMAPYADDTVTRWFSPAFQAAGKAEGIRSAIRSMQVEGFAAAATVLQAYSFLDVLPRIDVPTLLVVGERDGAMPESMRNMHREIGGSHFIEIADAGHIPNLEQPDAFNAALRSFLHETRGRG